MTQYLLQHVNIASVTQKIDGKGVSEPVRMHFPHPGPLSDASNKPAQTVAIEW
jgi:hypothetical protein